MKRKQPFSYEEFKSIYSRVTRLCVDLIIKTEKGYLLTLRQEDGWINQWHCIGGTVLFREKITDAVQRIAKEEIGTTVIIEKFLGYAEYFSEVSERGFGYSVALNFLCKLPKGISVPQTFFKTIPDNTVAEQKEFIKKHLGE